MSFPTGLACTSAARAANYNICSASTVNEVVSATSAKHIVASSTADNIVAVMAVNDVPAGHTVYDIVSVGPDKPFQSRGSDYRRQEAVTFWLRWGG